MVADEVVYPSDGSSRTTASRVSDPNLKPTPLAPALCELQFNSRPTKALNRFFYESLERIRLVMPRELDYGSTPGRRHFGRISENSKLLAGNGEKSGLVCDSYG